MAKRKLDTKRLQKTIKTFLISSILISLILVVVFHIKMRTEPVNCVPYGDGITCLGFPNIRLYAKLRKIFLITAATIPVSYAFIAWLFNYLFPKKKVEARKNE